MIFPRKARRIMKRERRGLVEMEERSKCRPIETKKKGTMRVRRIFSKMAIGFDSFLPFFLIFFQRRFRRPFECGGFSVFFSIMTPRKKAKMAEAIRRSSMRLAVCRKIVTRRKKARPRMSSTMPDASIAEPTLLWVFLASMRTSAVVPSALMLRQTPTMMAGMRGRP